MWIQVQILSEGRPEVSESLWRWNYWWLWTNMGVGNQTRVLWKNSISAESSLQPWILVKRGKRCTGSETVRGSCPGPSCRAGQNSALPLTLPSELFRLSWQEESFPSSWRVPWCQCCPEPWLFTSAKCSLVICYSFSVRKAKTGLQRKAHCGPSMAQTSDLAVWILACLSAQPSVLWSCPKKASVNSVGWRARWKDAGEGTWHSDCWHNSSQLLFTQ